MKRVFILGTLFGAIFSGCAGGAGTASTHPHSQGPASNGIDPVTQAGIDDSNRATQDSIDASNRAATDAANAAAAQQAIDSANQASAAATQAAVNAATNQ